MTPGKVLYTRRGERKTPSPPPQVHQEVVEDLSVDLPVKPGQASHIPQELFARIVSEFIPIEEILRDQLWLISRRLQNKILKSAIVHQDLSPRLRQQVWLGPLGRTDLIIQAEREKLGLASSAPAEEIFKFYRNFDRSPESISEIERDVVRTMPFNLNFSLKSETGPANRDKLQSVLLAASAAEPSVGYCQGMNFVVATLLVAFDFNESKAFFMFLAILRHYHFKHLYSPSVPLLPLRMFHFSRLVREHVPQVWHHLNSKTFSVEIFANQWIMTLYSYYIEPDILADKIWTLFFLLGWKFLLQFGVAILSLLEPQIVQMDVEEISAFMATSSRSSSSPIGTFSANSHPFSRESKIKDQLVYAIERFRIRNRDLDIYSQQFISAKLIQVVSTADLAVTTPRSLYDRKPNPEEIIVDETRIMGFSWVRMIADNTLVYLQIDLSSVSTPNRPREIISSPTKIVNVPVRSLIQLQQAVALVAENFNRDIAKISLQLQEVEKRLTAETKQFNALIATASKTDESFREVGRRKLVLTDALRDAVVSPGNTTLGGDSASGGIMPKDINELMKAVSAIEREYDERKEAKKAVYDVLVEQDKRMSTISDEKNCLIIKISSLAAQLEEFRNEIIYRSIQSAIASFS